MLWASRRVIRRRRRSSSVTLGRFMIAQGRGELRCCTSVPHKRGYDNMPIVRAGGVLLCAAAAATLAGCAGTRLSPDAPAGGTPGGAWELKSHPSDQPQK